MSNPAGPWRGSTPLWMVQDPRTGAISVDVQEAARAGVAEIEVSFDEATNNVAVEARKVRKENRP